MPRQGRGHRPAGRRRTRSALVPAVWLALRLTGIVLCAAAVVMVLEVGVLRVDGWGSWHGGERPPVADLLAVGAVLVAPLTLLFGGWRMVRGHADAVRDLAVDDLTGTWSRRALGEDLPEAVLDASAGAGPLTLALVELTGVSAAADLLGRRRADALVRSAAATLNGIEHGATGGRAGDVAEPVAYRLSADVFAVVLSGAGPDAAFDLVDGLLEHVVRAAAPLSAVAGLCTLDVRCPDAQLLLLGASAALDEARALGPGRVVASADEASGLRWVASQGTDAAPPSPTS
jgi:GGDEF domain-containing protein